MSVLKNYPSHVPLRWIDRALMTVTCGIGATLHPENNNYITGIGEITAYEPVLNKLRNQMLSDPVGRRILRERPHITSQSLDLQYLQSLPETTFGKTYYNWLAKEGVSPDTREPVHYIDDEELAFVFQRYRQCHDFHHAIAGLPIVLEGEIAIKAFEFANFGLPFAGIGTLLSPLKLSAKQRKRLFDLYYPWSFSNGLNCKPLINVYWEKILEKDVDELRRELGIEAPPPDLRQLRKQMGLKKKELHLPK